MGSDKNDIAKKMFEPLRAPYWEIREGWNEFLNISNRREGVIMGRRGNKFCKRKETRPFLGLRAVVGGRVRGVRSEKGRCAQHTTDT